MLQLVFFFFNDTATTEIYTLSLHDALPISAFVILALPALALSVFVARLPEPRRGGDRKSTRLNSSHSQISYAVFCLKKKTMQRELLYHPRMLITRIVHTPRLAPRDRATLS